MNDTTATRVTLSIEPHGGYAADQIQTDVTLTDLLELVESAIAEHGPDAVVVTYDPTNRYGAKYGRLSPIAGITAEDDDDDADRWA